MAGLEALTEAIEAESTLTDRYQTTVPSSVRAALGLSKRDRLHYEVRNDGTVLLRKAGEEDPALEPFLSLLEKDISSRPEFLQPLTADAMNRATELVGEIKIDLDEPLDDDDE